MGFGFAAVFMTVPQLPLAGEPQFGFFRVHRHFNLLSFLGAYCLTTALTGASMLIAVGGYDAGFKVCVFFGACGTGFAFSGIIDWILTKPSQLT